MSDDRADYRAVIDRLVHACQSGQGQIGPRRARTGLWNRNAHDGAEGMADQAAMNSLLRRLTAADREVLAQMLAHEFVGGVHQTLVVLHQAGIAPFDDGYEGAPFLDFAGRLDDWPWPNEDDPTSTRPEWVVWRQDDNGNRYEVSRHESHADAQAVAQEMEARGHRQTYWVAHLNRDATGPHTA